MSSILNAKTADGRTRCPCLWIRRFFVLTGEVRSVNDIAQIIFDLVHYGGFNKADVEEMPLFERAYHHQKTIDSVEKDVEFQLALHDKKRR